MFVGDKWTGIEIDERYALLIPKVPPIPFKMLLVKPSTWRVVFFAHGNIENKAEHVIEVSTLSRARKVGELYYKEWLQCNT